MSDPIPPRPWRVTRTTSVALSAISTVNGDPVSLGNVHTDEHGALKLFPDATAEHIVRLVNAEPEIVAALEAAYQTLLVGHKSAEDTRRSFGMVRAALAKLRG